MLALEETVDDEIDAEHNKRGEQESVDHVENDA